MMKNDIVAVASGRPTRSIFSVGKHIGFLSYEIPKQLEISRVVASSVDELDDKRDTLFLTVLVGAILDQAT
jgi:hypothetical protein